MKHLSFIVFLFSFSMCVAQSLPIDFENSIITISDFNDFDGGEASIISNPQSSGINTSLTVAQIIREGGEVWAGSKIILSENLDFSSNSIISMKVFMTAPIGTIVKFKLEGNGATERDAFTTTTNEWETLTWDFTGEPANFNEIVFMFDFGNTGDGSVSSTFLFDDIEQLYAGAQIDLPVSFEGNSINYALTDFEGNSSALVVDPTNNNNTVVQSMKMPSATPSAGVTIGTPAGFANYIPLTLTDSKMTVKVWSPDAGTPIRLKVEDSNDPTHTCETEVNTTIGGDWEILEFDFTNEALGTASLEFGLNNGWAYNKASIFFNFGTVDEKTYYFDNVAFGDFVLNDENVLLEKIKVFPNPSTQFWIIDSPDILIENIELYNFQGQLIFSRKSNNYLERIETRNLPAGSYIVKIITQKGNQNIRLIKS